MSALFTAMPDSQQQQTGESSGRGWENAVTYRAGRQLQRDHSPPSSDRGHDQPQVTQPQVRALSNHSIK